MNNTIRFFCIKCGSLYNERWYYEDGEIMIYKCKCGTRTVINMGNTIRLTALNVYKRAYKSKKERKKA